MAIPLLERKQIEAPNFGKQLFETAQTLAWMQTIEGRDIILESQVAQAPIQRINFATRGWHSDFAPTVTVTATGIVMSDYYPPSAISNREDLLDFMRRQHYSFDIKPYAGNQVNTYLEGFSRGDELGYEKELGNTWYLQMGSNRGTFYIPVENISQIDGIGF